MKRKLTWLLILMTITAVLIACTTGQGGDETTVGDSTGASDPVVTTGVADATDSATHAPVTSTAIVDDLQTQAPESTSVTTASIVTETPVVSEPVTEDPAETTVAVTEPQTEAGPMGVRLNQDDVTRYLSMANAVKYEMVEDPEEGKVLKLSTTAASGDPYVYFNYLSYARKYKVGFIQNVAEYPYLILRVKAENCSNSKFEMFYCSGAITGPSGSYVLQKTFNNASDEWQYIVFDMNQAINWTGAFNGMRFDYLVSAAGAGETMYISAIYFAKTEEEMREITLSGVENPFEIETDPVVESKVEELLATPDSAANVGNEKINAEHEDANLDMWFNHAYTKTAAENYTSTGLNTYQLRMAKNEAEGMHLLLSSLTGHTGLTVSVSSFRNSAGDELKTELMYGYYFDDVDGQTIPDPTPWVQDGQTFALETGRSYMFIIKATSYMDSPAGQYEATVTVTDADGKQLKKAVVYAHVWNFTLPEETSCKTQMDLSWYNIYVTHDLPEGDDGLLYKKYYDFMLENRICAYTLPYNEDGYFTDSRILEYLDNPRVVAFNPLGWTTKATAENVSAAYAFLSQKEEWLDKSYFYLVDEPNEMDGTPGDLQRINEYGALLSRHFPGYKMMSPMHVNHVLNTDSTEDYFTTIDDYINVWCFKPYFFTTYEQYSYDQRLTYWMTPMLEKNLGTFAERMYKEQAEGDELWWYVTRRPENPEITLLMDTESIRHRILFWQQKLYNVDSFLYYLINDWYDFEMFTDKDGVNPKHEVQEGTDAFDCYGNGVLLYCGKTFGVDGPIGSLRLENVRDGIEDFEYLTMLNDMYGEEITNAIIHRLTTSLSNYNMDIDNFTDLRIAVGNIIEDTLADAE